MRRTWLLALFGWFGCSESPESPSTARPAPATAPIALTPTEYNHTVRDLLGLPNDGQAWPAPPEVAVRLSPVSRARAGLFGSKPIVPPPWPWPFPEENGLDHFEGFADGQAPSPYGVEEFQKAAMHFAAYALVSPSFFVCDDWSSADADRKKSCAWESVGRLAQRAWRRPMTEDEETRLEVFFDANYTRSTPEEAIALTIAGILQTPSFLYRIEASPSAGPTPLDGWALASRLSYFLWDSMPDAELFGAAARGALATREQVEAQARRMLTDSRARRALVHFHHQWLGTNEVQRISPARRVFGPTFGVSPTPPLDTTGDEIWPRVLGPIRHSMEAETHLFVERTIFDGSGTLEGLLSGRNGYISDRTAPLYGPNLARRAGDSVQWSYGLVAASLGSRGALELYPVEFAEGERAGVLTLPSVLALGAHPVHPSPILRGKRILERVLCESLGSPPPGAEAAAPADTEDAEATNRARTEAATAPVQCAGCHSRINPPGFAFEQFDAMGAYRAEDNGVPIDAGGRFSGGGGEQFEFDGAVELARQLSTSNQVRDCYVLRWARYATGVMLEADHPAVAELQRAFRADDDIQGLLVRIAGSDLLRFHTSEGAR